MDKGTSIITYRIYHLIIIIKTRLGSNIQTLTSLDKDCLPLATSSPALTSSPLVKQSQDDNTVMVRASRHLLSAITRVLLLADIVVVKQLIDAKTKVSTSFSARA